MQFLALSVEDLLRGLCGWLCQFFYWLVAWLYELFMNISRVEILTSDNIKPIYQRITMILTIIMVFYVTFEAVKYVIQPEEFTDKEKGGHKLVLKMVLVVVLIAFVPQIFSMAYKFQNAVFDNQLFSKVILGKQSVDSAKFGRVFSANILGMFYYADEANWSKSELETADNCDDIPCKNVVNINLNSLVEYGELPLMQLGLTSKGEKKDEGAGGGVDKYYIHFDGLFAVIVGGFMTYMLVLYCVDAGVRVAQLAFLQIIAPIPIIGYLSPKKDGIFQKWMKQCFTTYLDLFIRVGIIYFVLLICQILSDAYSSGTLLNNIPGDASTTMKVFIYIALVMGLLLFAKKAPKMLEELFPKSGAASGNFGLKPGERVAPLAARTAGAAIGAGLVGAKGLVGAAVNQTKRNWRNLRSGKHKEDLGNFGKSTMNRLNKFGAKASAGWRRIQAIGGSAEERAAAKAEYKNAKQQYKDAKIDHQSATAAVKNSRFRFGAVAGVTGAVGGMVRGATSGGQATELKSIGKQVSQGLKKESEALAKTEKWYNEGGGSNFDRVMTSVEKGLGISTEADRRAEEIKYYDDQLKAIDNAAKREEAALSTAKKSTDVNEGKIESGKSKHEGTAEDAAKIASKLGYDDAGALYDKLSGYGVEKDGKFKLKDVYNIAQAEADSKKAIAEEAARRALNATTDEERTAAQEAQAKAEAEAMQARNKATNAKKVLGEYSVQQYLTERQKAEGDRKLDLFDAEAMTSVDQTIENIKISVSHSDTRNRLLESLGIDPRGTLTTEQEALYEGIKNPDSISEFDVYDKLSKALNSVASNRRVHDSSHLQATKNRLETSDANAAAKADNTAAGNK